MKYLLILALSFPLIIPHATQANNQSCNLTQQHCLPCEGGIPPLEPEQIAQLLTLIPGWEKNQSHQNRIIKRYIFSTAKAAHKFINDIAPLAEQEGHHPDIFIAKNVLELHLYTHAANGLTDNDFILAAKINNLMLPTEPINTPDEISPDDKIITENEQNKLLEKSNNWTINTANDNSKLTREVIFNDFVQAINFLNWLGQKTDSLKIYPEIYIFYNRVNISFITPGKTFTRNTFNLICTINEKIETSTP